MLMLFLAALIAAACEGAEAFVVPGHSPMRLRAALAGRMGRGPPIFHDRIALSRFHGSVARGRRAPSAAGRTEGLRMGGYEVSSATSMGTEYTFLAAKCFVDGAVQPAEVKVENERIAYVCVLTEGEYKAALQAAPKSVLPIGPEILLLPALVNAHTHLAMGALRGVTDGDAFTGNVVEDLFFRLEVALQPDDVRAFVRMGCWEAMLAGTGCVWEHYYFGDAIADAFLDTGMTGAIAPTLQDLSGPGLVLPGCGAEDSMRTTMAIHRNETLRSKGVVAALGPHATDTVSPQVSFDTVSLQLWQTIAATAAAEMLPIHSHVAQSIEEFQRIRERHACTPVELLEKNGVLSADAKMLLVHSMFLSQSDLNKLDPEKHVLGLCPASAVQFGFPCNYPAWRANGLQVALGTDAACSNDNMDVQGELRLLAGGGVFGVWSSQESAEFLEGGSDAQAAGVQAVRQAVRQALLRASSEWNKPGELLKTVTSVPGSLHPALPVGAIRSGALANLLFVRLDHPNMWPSLAPLRGVCFSSLAPAIDGLMVAGKWVGQRGNFHQSVVRSERYERHRQEADRRFADLLVRAGIR